ncbi:hypothetical protein [Ekhidna sp.]|uniref:hypothetical protein n=1 Tax=Ekhidna sp. TaxID=2608089 RepID=UPI003BA95E20
MTEEQGEKIIKYLKNIDGQLGSIYDELNRIYSYASDIKSSVCDLDDINNSIQEVKDKL